MSSKNSLRKKIAQEMKEIKNPKVTRKVRLIKCKIIFIRIVLACYKIDWIIWLKIYQSSTKDFFFKFRGRNLACQTLKIGNHNKKLMSTNGPKMTTRMSLTKICSVYTPKHQLIGTKHHQSTVLMSQQKFTIQQEIKRKLLKESHGQSEVSFETKKIKH